MDEPAGLIGEGCICSTATILGLLPGACVLPYFRRLRVLQRWLIVIVNSDALLPELLDLLPRRRSRQAAFNVGSSIPIG